MALYMKMSTRVPFIVAVYSNMGCEVEFVSRQDVLDLVEMEGIKIPTWFMSKEYATGDRGVYDFAKLVSETTGAMNKLESVKQPRKRIERKVESTGDSIAPARTMQPTPPPTPHVPGNTPSHVTRLNDVVHVENYVPVQDPTFVHFGYSRKLAKILASKVFFPVFVAGESGVGKSFCAEQVCAELEREVITVPITIETTEDDLLGGFRLVNGETVWCNGPVIEAMTRGAVLLLEEIDLASHKIMCIMTVLNNASIYLKKINKLIKAEPGFNVVATANTKGRGKWKGQYVGTNILNDALLERFGALFEQSYPSVTIENRILNNAYEQLTTLDDDVTNFIMLLVEWANQIRRNYANELVTEVISTRRLIHIIKYYSIFKNRLDSVTQGTARFSDNNKDSFVQLYGGMDGDANLLTKLLDQQNSAGPTDQQPMAEVVKVTF